MELGLKVSHELVLRRAPWHWLSDARVQTLEQARQLPFRVKGGNP